MIGKNFLKSINWNPWKEEHIKVGEQKKAEVAAMLSAMSTLTNLPEWKFYERYLSLKAERAMADMLASETAVAVAEYKGRRDALVKDALGVLKNLQNAQKFLESLEQEHENA